MICCPNHALVLQVNIFCEVNDAFVKMIDGVDKYYLLDVGLRLMECREANKERNIMHETDGLVQERLNSSVFSNGVMSFFALNHQN